MKRGLLALVLIICMTAVIMTPASAAQKLSDGSDVSVGADQRNITTTYIVTLYWDDDENAYGTRPEEVTALLTANNGELGSDYLSLSDENGWEYVDSLLPVYYEKGSRSGKINYQVEIPDLPEKYSMMTERAGNWFKITCSLDRPTLLGDVDSDHAVTSADATAIQRHVTGMSVPSFNEIPGDVNGDQHIDIMDVSVIRRYLAGYDCDRYKVGNMIL